MTRPETQPSPATGMPALQLPESGPAQRSLGESGWAAIAIDPLRAHFFDAPAGASAVSVCRNAASDPRFLVPAYGLRPCPECLSRRALARLAEVLAL